MPCGKGKDGRRVKPNQSQFCGERLAAPVSVPQTCLWRLSFDGLSPDSSETSVECHRWMVQERRFTGAHNSAEMDTELPEGPGDTTAGTCGEMAEAELV